jgi:hypothetical protein
MLNMMNALNLKNNFIDVELGQQNDELDEEDSKNTI